MPSAGTAWPTARCSSAATLPTAAIVAGGAAAEARQCLANLGTIAQACGAELDDALRVTVHLTELADDFAAVDSVFASTFEREPPARIAVGVAALPAGARVAVDAIVPIRTAGAPAR